LRKSQDEIDRLNRLQGGINQELQARVRQLEGENQ